MKKLVFSGIAAAAMTMAITPAQASDSFGYVSADAPVGSDSDALSAARGGGQRIHSGARSLGSRSLGGRSLAGRSLVGRWHGGLRAPGGYAAYQRPLRGFNLPRYWVNPGFAFSNFAFFGLRAPQTGYYWSRYYDDAVLINNRGTVYDSVSNVDWQAASPRPQAQAGFPQAEFGPAIETDQQVYGWDDEANDPSVGGTNEAGTYEGEWTGQYIDEDRRVYRGQWDGNYTGEDGRVFKGTYRGTATGDAVVSNKPQRPHTQVQQHSNQGPAWQQPPQQQQSWQQQSNDQDAGNGGDYAVPGGYERYEQCLRGRGLTGGAIGTLLGGFAGNRIAGRGNRLAGTLAGAGLGALAGVGIEKAVNKCRKHLPRQIARPGYYPQQRPVYAPSQGQVFYPQYPAGYGWQGGYYPQQAPVVTTVTIIPGTVTTTTETTEEVIYETVAARRPVTRHIKGKGLRRPAPTKKRCGC